MAKATFHKKTSLFTRKLDLNLRTNIWSTALYVLKLGHSQKLIRNTWEVLKCNAGGWK
jgi:hypothetical protein